MIHRELDAHGIRPRSRSLRRPGDSAAAERKSAARSCRAGTFLHDAVPGDRSLGPGLAVRSVEQGLQAGCQFTRQFQTPRFINEPDADQIAEMSAVLVAERREFHPHERVEAQHAKRFRGLRLDHIRSWQGMIRAHSFTREDDVDRIPGFRLRTVEEQVYAGDVPINEARRFKGGPWSRPDPSEVSAGPRLA